MDAKKIESEHLVPMYFKREKTFVEGDGTYLIDSEGKRYLDFVTHQGLSILGYGNKGFSDAIANQAKKLQSCHNSFYNDTRVKFLEKLHSVLPAHLSRTIILSTGTEAVEAALKLVQKSTGKQGVISTLGSYHGRSLGALSAMGVKKYREPFEPLLSHFKQVRFNDADVIEAAIDENTGAVMIEPIQGENGVVLAAAEYLRRVREICDKHELLLIFDEIQTAVRTGSWLYTESIGVKADIVCISKAIANGFPLSVTVTTEDVSDSIKFGDHGSTFGGNPMAMAAGLYTISEIEKRDLLSRASEMGDLLRKRLTEGIGELKPVREIRGAGLMIGIDLKTRSGAVTRELQSSGLIVSASGGTVLRMLPPLTVEESHIEEAVSILKEVLSKL